MFIIQLNMSDSAVYYTGTPVWSMLRYQAKSYNTQTEANIKLADLKPVYPEDKMSVVRNTVNHKTV